MRGIELVPLGRVDMRAVDFLSLVLPDTFRVPCSVRKLAIDIEPAFDPKRRQYHSTKLIVRLLDFARRDYKMLGVTDVDLHIPILTFVFGEAQLGRYCAVVSTSRLHQGFYGFEEDEVLFLERLEKEAIHELGHTLGLIHCQDYACVMHYANAIEDIDLKANTFCHACISTVQQNLLAGR